MSEVTKFVNLFLHIEPDGLAKFEDGTNYINLYASDNIEWNNFLFYLDNVCNNEETRYVLKVIDEYTKKDLNLRSVKLLVTKYIYKYPRIEDKVGTYDTILEMVKNNYNEASCLREQVTTPYHKRHLSIIITELENIQARIETFLKKDENDNT